MSAQPSTISLQRSFAFAKVDTNTMSDLASSSWKLANQSHGRVWSFIDSSVSYLQTALFSAVRLVVHCAMAIFSFLTIWSQAGRHFFKENTSRALIDLAGVAIGTLGVIYPYGAEKLTAKLIIQLNKSTLNYQIYSEQELKEEKYADPVWISRFMYHYMQTYLQQAKALYPEREWRISLTD